MDRARRRGSVECKEMLRAEQMVAARVKCYPDALAVMAVKRGDVAKAEMPSTGDGADDALLAIDAAAGQMRYRDAIAAVAEAEANALADKGLRVRSLTTGGARGDRPRRVESACGW